MILPRNRLPSWKIPSVISRRMKFLLVHRHGRLDVLSKYFEFPLGEHFPSDRTASHTETRREIYDG